MWFTARSPPKAEEAIAQLEKETGRRARFLQLDLSDLSSVKRSAEEFKSYEALFTPVHATCTHRRVHRQQRRLDVLILNAGVMHPPIDELTAQGYDMQFGTNVLGVLAPLFRPSNRRKMTVLLGHFLLIKLLLPLLRSTATGSSATGEPSRIVWVSSSTNYYFNPPMKYDTLKDSPQRSALGAT